ncbi:MAG TPA: ribonuclease domain-containing protein [Casimicrobiaceae bacterium]|nr:ribonuclease domain-containing protein [Casimicrobiaceae bacterium]
MIRPPIRAALLLLAIAALSIAAPTALARGNENLRGEINASALPREAREVLIRIHDGGPFRYERDGITFGNREQSLPPRRRGYYHEYTVRTPGVRTRGARRIVCGGARKAPEVCYYSDDHYATFRRIRE